MQIEVNNQFPFDPALLQAQQFDPTLVQVTKLHKVGTVATNQSYFDGYEQCYIYSEGNLIYMTREKPNVEEFCIRRCARHGKVYQHRVVTIPLPLMKKVGFVPGVDYIAVREQGDKFVLSRATQSEIDAYGTKTHRKAVISGEVRNGRFLFFTPEEKDLLAIGHSSRSRDDYLKVTFNVASASYMEIERLKTKEDAFKYPTLLEFWKEFGREAAAKGPVTYRVRYAQAFAIPAAFVKACGLKAGDIMPSTIVGNKIIFEAPDAFCDFCGKQINHKKEKASKICVCGSCSEVLPDLKKLIMQNGADVVAAAKELRNSLNEAIEAYERKES